MTWLKGDKSTLEPRVAERRLMIVILTWAVSGGSPEDEHGGGQQQ